MSRGFARPSSLTAPRRALLAAWAAVAWLVAGVALAQPEWRFPAAPRIVVVPDVHGAYPQLVELLAATGLVDDSLAWRGGNAVLVSLGDLLDRGPESRKVMDLLMRLQRDAPASGGAVHVLLGNHEAMNLMGDLRYVSAGEYAEFAAEETPALRESAYEELRRTQPDAAEPPNADAEYPPGFFARREALSPAGAYGSWLLTLPAVVVIGDIAFAHGGLSEIVNEDVNARVHASLREYVGLAAVLERDASSSEGDDGVARDARMLALASSGPLGPRGPLWYRGSAWCNPALEEPVLRAALERLGAERLVVGHTPTADRRARELYDGRLVMLDTGMLTDYYAGRPAALIIEPDRMLVQYVAPRQQRPLEQGPLEAYGLTEQEILRVLTGGAIEAIGAEAGRDAEPTRVEVHDGETVLRAMLWSDGADAELAAYALDRLLGLNLVPPTVAREVDGRTAALQLEYPDAVTEAQRVEQRLPLGEFCSLEPQWKLMYAFDALLAHGGRAADTVLYRRETSRLALVGHAGAFGSTRRARLPDGVALPAQLRDRLAALDESAVRDALGDRLDERPIRALLARARNLLESADAD